MKAHWAGLLLAFLALASCGERSAQVSKPKTHTLGAVSFNYPGNWEVAVNTLESEFHNIILETPGDAIVVVQVHAPTEEQPLLEQAKAFAAQTKDVSPEIKAHPSDFKATEGRNGFERIGETFDVSLLGQRVPHRRIHARKTEGAQQIYAIMQVATEDHKEVVPGFDLIIDSIKVKSP